MGEYEDQLREIQEALDAADEAMNHLESAKKCLNSASNWGIVDILGGGFMTTMIKRSRMSDAKYEMEQADRALDAFRRELQDVKGAGRLDIEMDDFLGFADYIFDNAFVDFLQQNRISDAKHNVDRAIEEVGRMIESLEDQQEEIVSHL